MNVDLSHFMADNNKPLIVSFSNFLGEHDVATKVGFEFWDLFGYAEGDTPVLAAIIRKGILRPKEIFRLSDKIAPVKVVFIEGDDLDPADIDTMKMFLASMGVSMYVRNVGWLVTKTKGIIPMADDWPFQMLKRYTQNEEDVWGKVCHTCNKWTPYWNFYARGGDAVNAKDPRRNLCKSCSKADWTKKKERLAAEAAAQA